MKNSRKQIYLVLLLIIIFICLYRNNNSYCTEENLLNGFKHITSIEYACTTEVKGNSERKQKIVSRVWYRYPGEIRMENEEGTDIKIEIYNKNKYYRSFNDDNKLIYMDCFTNNQIELLESVNEVKDILQSRKYINLGYEDKGGIRVQIISTNWNEDDHKYINKFYIGWFEGYILPFKGEYLVDGSVVLKKDYVYKSINSKIDPKIFEIDEQNYKELIYSGTIPYYANSFSDAQKYVDFKVMKIPSGDYNLAVIKINKNSNEEFITAVCTKKFRTITVTQGKQGKVNKNGQIGSFSCEYNVEGKKFNISWVQNSIFITVSGETSDFYFIKYLSELISGGEFKTN